MLAVAGCGKRKASKSSKKTTSGSTVIAGTKSSQTAIQAQKKNATKTSSTPKPVPSSVSSGSNTVSPPQLSGMTYETWSFAGVDIDGDGELESGVALYDSTDDILCVWWDESDYLAGEMVSFDAFAWISDDSVGFILALDGGGVFGCAEAMGSMSAAAGCVACDGSGDCEALAVDEDYDDD